MALVSDATLTRDGSDITADSTIFGAMGVAGNSGSASPPGSGSDTTPTRTGFYPSNTYGAFTRAGGGNYAPNIYSTPQRMNFSKPATMVPKTSYPEHNMSFLRPSISTKGSREAYKRQDM